MDTSLAVSKSACSMALCAGWMVGLLKKETSSSESAHCSLSVGCACSIRSVSLWLVSDIVYHRQPVTCNSNPTTVHPRHLLTLVHLLSLLLFLLHLPLLLFLLFLSLFFSLPLSPFFTASSFSCLQNISFISVIVSLFHPHSERESRESSSLSLSPALQLKMRLSLSFLSLSLYLSLSLLFFRQLGI